MNALEYSTATFERHLPSSVACSASDTSETSLGLLPVSPSSESSWRQKKKKIFYTFLENLENMEKSPWTGDEWSVPFSTSGLTSFLDEGGQ